MIAKTEKNIPWSQCPIHQIILLPGLSSTTSRSCWRCSQFADIGHNSLCELLRLWRVSTKNTHSIILLQLLFVLQNVHHKGIHDNTWDFFGSPILALTNASYDLDQVYINRVHPNSRTYIDALTFSSARRCNPQTTTCTLHSWLYLHTKIPSPLHSRSIR